MRKRIFIGAALAVLLLAGAVGAFVAYRIHQGRNIKGSSSQEFVPTAIPKPKVAVKPMGVVWPTWGFDSQRLRTAAIALHPPYRTIWTFTGHSLLEFPPSIAYGRVFLPTFKGLFFALDGNTGKTIWRFESGRCGWSSPAIADHVVFQTFIGHDPNCDRPLPSTDGEVVAFDSRTGKVRWRRLTGPNESSPLVVKGIVYFGDWNGDVWALQAATGRVRWRFHTGGQIKGSAALAGPNIVIGSYDGHVYALNARSGREVWRAAAQPRFGALGTFYATPAIAYGRVYIGNTDGKVYSYGATSGKLRWSYGTGGYVYSSPAVWNRRVYAGSYDGKFYAFDAATGEPRWTFTANGPISGAPTVLDGIVYFSTFHRRTYGLDARTGKLVWSFPDGQYTPVVADRQHFYLIGSGHVYAMVEKR